MKTKYEIFVQRKTNFFSSESSLSPAFWILPKMYYSSIFQSFEGLIFRLLLLLSLFNQFKNIVAVFENSTFSSFKL